MTLGGGMSPRPPWVWHTRDSLNGDMHMRVGAQSGGGGGVNGDFSESDPEMGGGPGESGQQEQDMEAGREATRQSGRGQEACCQRRMSQCVRVRVPTALHS